MSAFDLPTDNRPLLIRNSQDIIQHCRVSVGARAAYYRLLNRTIETGQDSGEKSLVNLMFQHVDRLASHLFSPSSLRFTTEFTYKYPQREMDRGKMGAAIVTNAWENNNADILFGQGVFEALKYGAAILKQWPEAEGQDKIPIYRASLVMPWQFGVYREDQNDLDKQPAICETFLLTEPEVWRRIWHLPNPEKLMQRIISHGKANSGPNEFDAYFHQVLSTAKLNTNQQPLGANNGPGGIVGLTNSPGYVLSGPEVSAPLYRMHELWVQDGEDYTTVQIIEPDILIAPLFRKTNLLIPGQINSGLHPYDLIQPNFTQGYFWGRTELADLTEPQNWLSDTASAGRRLLQLQIDKVLAFTGDGLSDEVYAKFRAAGWIDLGQGGKAEDLTPKFPEQLLPMLEMQMQIIDRIGGFDNMLSGRGESGVRSGVQNNTMLKTASPRLRDRSLMVERQCANAADRLFTIAQAKDGRAYWTDYKNSEATEFLLKDIPDDAKIVVDSHSSSPIFQDDHQQLVFAGLKLGIIDPISAIEMLNLPMKETLIQRYQEAAEKKEKMLAELAKRDPEAYTKLITHSGGHH